MSYLGWCGSDPRFYHLTLDFMILYLESSFGYTPLFPFRIIHSLLSALTIQTDTRWNWISWSVVWCNRSVLFLHTSFTIARSFSRDQLDIHPVLTYCRQADSINLLIILAIHLLLSSRTTFYLLLRKVFNILPMKRWCILYQLPMIFDQHLRFYCSYLFFAASLISVHHIVKDFTWRWLEITPVKILWLI